ncbi:MAG: phosphatase PAP2 family protein [Bacteroidales bacterium]|nr:phosphatase PAP2 family protein [Bacteroidales bacterium]
MRRVIILLLAVLCGYPIKANSMVNDSIASSPSEHNFKPSEVMLPLTLMATGALGFVEPMSTWRVDIRDNLQEWRGDHRIHVDDYIQYVPIASIYGLSLLGAEAKHDYVDRTLELGVSYAALGVLTNVMKYSIRTPRPDGSSRNSFPSGHTATTFMGAELVRIEYGDESPWYTVGAYTIATGVAALRVYNNRHWFTDVVAGAGVGILCARIGHWMLPVTRRFMYNLTGMDAFVYPEVKEGGASLGLSMRF